MKIFRAVLIGFFIAQLPAFAQNTDDKSLIKNLIELETDAFFSVDRKTWESTWLDASYTYWSLSDSTGGSFVNGTQEIRKNFEDYFLTAKPSKATIERKWLEMRLYHNGAYVRFIQTTFDGIDKVQTSEMRVVEKDKDGKWKIVCLGSTSM